MLQAWIESGRSWRRQASLLAFNLKLDSRAFLQTEIYICQRVHERRATGKSCAAEASQRRKFQHVWLTQFKWLARIDTLNGDCGKCTLCQALLLSDQLSIATWQSRHTPGCDNIV